MKFLAQICEKATSAILTIPTINNWIVALLLLLIITAVCLPLGLWCRFLEIKIPKLSIMKVISVLVNRFLFPCLAEELIFRVLLLPAKNSHASIKTHIVLEGVSLTAYVISHPLNAFIIYRKALKTFTNPFFLLSTSILGISCTVLYVESSSIWISTIFHWIVVITWLIVLGGYSKLGFKENE